MHYLVYITFIVFISSFGLAQTDSIKYHIARTKVDSVKARLYTELSTTFAYSNLDSAFTYAKKAEEMLSVLNDFQKCAVLEWAGTLNAMKGRNDLALDYFIRQLKTAQNTNSNEQLANANINLAFVYQSLGNLDKMFSYFEKALESAKASKNKKIIDKILANGSDFYFNKQDYNKALALWKERLVYAPENKTDIWYIAGIGDIYRNTKQFDDADREYKKAIGIAIQKNDSSNLIILYNNYSLIPEEKNDLNGAINYLIRAKEIAAATGDSYNVASMNFRIANKYLALKNYKDAERYVNESLEYYLSKNQTKILVDLYKTKADIFLGLKNYKGAYESIIESINYKEELINRDAQNKIAKLESKLLEEQKNKEITVINKDLELQKRTRNYFIIGACLLLVFIAIILRSLVLNKRKNKIITVQKMETEKQKHLVDEKQKEILDSIRYAQRIQKSLLPSEKYIDKAIKRLS